MHWTTGFLTGCWTERPIPGKIPGRHASSFFLQPAPRGLSRRASPGVAPAPDRFNFRTRERITGIVRPVFPWPLSSFFVSRVPGYLPMNDRCIFRYRPVSPVVLTGHIGTPSGHRNCAPGYGVRYRWKFPYTGNRLCSVPCRQTSQAEGAMTSSCPQYLQKYCRLPVTILLWIRAVIECGMPQPH